jgi:hypothetical protein
MSTQGRKRASGSGDAQRTKLSGRERTGEARQRAVRLSERLGMVFGEKCKALNVGSLTKAGKFQA